MIYIMDEGFVGNEINPITNNPYDNTWIIFCLTHSQDYHMMNGGGVKTAYTLKVSKHYPHWMMSVCDFIEFQEANGKNIILSISNVDLEKAKQFYQGHNYNDNFLRDDEQDVLIHSTTLENWSNIQSDGCLKSWNILRREKEIWEYNPIGKQLGDPPDFSDYIMFSDGAISSEIVILSKQKGKITMNPDMQYTTGVRLYFDVKKIAEDGFLARDGCHLKVRDRLPLYPYLLWVADWKSACLPSSISTPKEFTQKANERFNKMFHGKVKKLFESYYEHNIYIEDLLTI